MGRVTAQVKLWRNMQPPVKTLGRARAYSVQDLAKFNPEGDIPLNEKNFLVGCTQQSRPPRMHNSQWQGVACSWHRR